MRELERQAARDGSGALKIVYFLSTSHLYATVIYPDVGPRCAQILGWPIPSVETMAEADCNIGIIDNRLIVSDLRLIDAFLEQSPKRSALFQVIRS